MLGGMCTRVGGFACFLGSQRIACGAAKGVSANGL